jgi:hypothetical protein
MMDAAPQPITNKNHFKVELTEMQAKNGMSMEKSFAEGSPKFMFCRAAS